MAVSLSPTTVPNGAVNSPYSVTLTASGGTAPYTFAVTTGTAPGGLSLASSGALTGTPTAAGSTTFTVTATDSTADTALTGTQQYTLVVTAASLVNDLACPSIACTGVGPVSFVLVEGQTYTCPRCEQQSVLTDGAMVTAPGYHK